MKKLITSIITLSPSIAFAQELTDIDSVAQKATNLGNLVIAIAISISVLWIIINVVRYLIAGKDGAARTEGGLRILFGVVGLFVILSIWGLVYILKNSFRTQDQAPTNDINRTTTLPSIRGTQNTTSGGGLRRSPRTSVDTFDYGNNAI